MSDPARILLVHERSTGRFPIGGPPARALSANVREAASTAELAAALEAEDAAVAVVDAGLRWTSALEVLRRLRERGPGAVRILALSGDDDPAIGVGALREGAADGLIPVPADRAAWTDLLDAVRVLADRRHARRSGRGVPHEVAAPDPDAVLRTAVELLRQNDRQHGLVLGSSPMTFYTVKPEVGMTWVSDNALLLSGFRPEQFLADGSLWSARIHPEDRERVLRDLAAMPTKGATTLEYRWQCAEGAYRWFVDHAMMVRDETGKPQEIIGAWMDVTGRKHGEEELRRLNGVLSAHQAALEVCHDVLTHHVSNSSMAVLMIVERLLLGRDGALASRQEDLLVRARRQAHELTLLADTARHLAHLRVKGLPEPGEPAELAILTRRVEDKVRALHLDRDPVVELEAGSAARVGNVPLLEQLLVVLVDAAVRHGVGEGRRTIRVRADRGAEGVCLRVSGGDQPDRAWLDQLLTGTQSGRPMPAAGLGAALAHELVVQGGGRIETRMRSDDPDVFEVGAHFPGGISWPAS